MSTTPTPYRGFRFPAAIINEAVWLYHCFSGCSWTSCWGCLGDEPLQAA